MNTVMNNVMKIVMNAVMNCVMNYIMNHVMNRVMNHVIWKMEILSVFTASIDHCDLVWMKGVAWQMSNSGALFYL